MREYRDYQGLRIRLTDERFEHIRYHPEMVPMERHIADTLSRPERVVESLSDAEARLYYRFYVGTRVGDKYLCGGQGAGRGCVCRHRLYDRQSEKRKRVMADRKVKIWYDREGDYLEVIFDQREGYFRETANDQVMEKVDMQGRVLGFSVLKISSLTEAPLEVAL